MSKKRPLDSDFGAFMERAERIEKVGEYAFIIGELADVSYNVGTSLWQQNFSLERILISHAIAFAPYLLVRTADHLSTDGFIRRAIKRRKVIPSEAHVLELDLKHKKVINLRYAQHKPVQALALSVMHEIPYAIGAALLPGYAMRRIISGTEAIMHNNSRHR